MKKIVLSISLAFLSFGMYAQEAQLNAAKSAYNSKNYDTVITSVEEVEEMLPNTNSVDPEVLAEVYFYAGNSAKSKGDMQKAAEFYSKLNELETKPYYQAKNKDTREQEFFFDKAVAEQVTNAGKYSRLKEKTLDAKYINQVIPELNTLAQKVFEEANSAFQAKDYTKAYNKFLESYYISKALGNENQLFAYYSAVAALQTEEKAKAIDLLQKLADEGFTGVQTRYIASLKETGQDASFPSKAEMDTQVKLGLYTNPRVETTDSMEEELYNNLVFAYYSTEQFENGIEAAQKALNKFPNNESIDQMLSAMYYKSGNSDQFISDLKKKAESGKATASDYFNLAKMLDDSGADKEEIKKYYKKSIELDPEYANSYLNLALVITEPEKEYVELMNANLGSSKKEQKIYNENAAKRKVLYDEALPYLEKAYQFSPDNVSLLKVLMNAYDVLGNDDKYMELKNKLKSLSN